MNQEILNIEPCPHVGDDEAITLVFRRRKPALPLLPAPDPGNPARRCPGGPGNGGSPAGSEDMAPGEVEYEVVDLEGDLDGGPPHLWGRVPEEIAMLSGSLFDDLPRVEVPLETFFPAEYRGSPAWHRTRSDSLSPVANTARREPRKRRLNPNWFVGMAAAAVIGLTAGALAPRPAATSLAASPKSITAQATAVETPAIEAPSATSAAPKPAIEACRSPAKAARPGSSAPVTLDSAPLRSTAVAKADPVIEDMPIAPPAPPPPPEIPEQQTTAIAVAWAARGAASCFEPDELRRTMAVSVTFAPSGRATRAVIEGGPHRATLVGSCIARHLRDAAIKPFEGPAITVHTTVHIR